MRALLALVVVVALLVGGAMALGLVTITRTRDAKLPDLTVKGGQAPVFKAEVANISLEHESRNVSVPTVEMTERQIDLPKVKVTKPDEKRPVDDR